MKENKLKTGLRFVFDADAPELEFASMGIEADFKNNVKDKTIKIIKRKKIKISDGSTRLF